MKIAIDVSPIEDINKLAHRVRGTGFYISNLKESFLKFYPDNKYIFFSNSSELTKDIDIVHYPYFEPFFLTLPIFLRNRIVVTVHDLTPLVFPEHFKIGIKGKIKWQMQRSALRRVDAIITDSISSKKDIIKFTGIEEHGVNVVYLAAGDQFKKLQNAESKIQNLRKKYNLPEKFALYVGDVTWNKNLTRLIEAVEKINVPLVMVGKALVDKSADLGNPWNKDLVNVREKIETNKKIICLGFVSNEDLVLLYNSATVFAMPSLYEGFGLPILEAMSCGCPVVTSQSGSIPEIGGDAPFYVDPYDIDNIAQGLKKVFLDEKLRKILSEKGIQQEKKFTWKKTVSQTMSVYEKASGYMRENSIYFAKSLCF